MSKNKQQIYCKLLLSVCCLSALLCISGNAFAWARHNLITYYTIQEIPWLAHFRKIAVSARQHKDDSINPDYTPVFENPNPAHSIQTPEHFVYYDLTAQNKYGFIGAPIGDKTNAIRILTDFSDEPDWGMDKNMELDESQKFMGGSQGYRHMYYPDNTFHIPYLFAPQGNAPKRAVHFYELARQAFNEGDLYWGFRFLARTLGYIQDMAQPYHTTQTCWAFFHIKSPVNSTTETTKNYHFAYESLAARIMELEAAGKSPPEYLQALRMAPSFTAYNVRELAVMIARRSHELSAATFAASVELFGKKLYAGHAVQISAEDVESMLNHPERPEFNRRAKDALTLAAAGTKRLLELAYKDFRLDKATTANFLLNLNKTRKVQ